MGQRKLKLNEVSVETFVVTEAEEQEGTVEANMLRTVVGGTCRGQTIACTACPPSDCA